MAFFRGFALCFSFSLFLPPHQLFFWIQFALVILGRICRTEDNGVMKITLDGWISSREKQKKLGLDDELFLIRN